ncbi:hypothetical protein PSTT_04164 [Puccinia striiformis]|uniref:Uncharacterized protein n=1 Tax=Puccinia striiformis TaxID=27350 RepID=A0A2S4VTV9_9BASI|nr:hypothetical protein PSTT_04164 [Puccinia striiformis]
MEEETPEIKDFVGCLLVGYTRNLLSGTLFDQICLILNELCHLKIPAWSSIYWSQKRIRDLLGLEVKMQESVWGMPCAVLSSRRALQQHLAKPLVSPHIDFYPEDTKGVNQYKLSQSQKWLTMSPSLRTQMCVNNTKHFHNFEPLETYSKQLYVPIFFCIMDGELHAKCVIPTIRTTSWASYQLRIPQNIKFNDPTLFTVKTKEFAKEYPEIKQNNLPLSIICANKFFEVNGDNSPIHGGKRLGDFFHLISPSACMPMTHPETFRNAGTNIYPSTTLWQAYLQIYPTKNTTVMFLPCNRGYHERV